VKCCFVSSPPQWPNCLSVIAPLARLAETPEERERVRSVRLDLLVRPAFAGYARMIVDRVAELNPTGCRSRQFRQLDTPTKPRASGCCTPKFRTDQHHGVGLPPRTASRDHHWRRGDGQGVRATLGAVRDYRSPRSQLPSLRCRWWRGHLKPEDTRACDAYAARLSS
jgi:hypothetical protein